MSKLFLILCLAFLCESHTPPRPDIPQTSEFHFKVESNGTKDTYIGHYAVVYPKMSVLNQTFERPNHQPETEYELIRDDMKKSFDIQWHNNIPECKEYNRSNGVLDFWKFVKETKYVGKETINGEVLNIWEELEKEDREYLAVGVKEDQPNVPVLFRGRSKRGNEEVNYYFTKFSAMPKDSEFEVPQVCRKTFSYVQ